MAAASGASRSLKVGVLLVVVTGCLRPGLFEEVPARGSAGWRPLDASEKDAIRRRFADEKVDLRDTDIDALRVPASEAPYVEWSRTRTFRGARVAFEFRIIRFRSSPQGRGWPPSFTLFREPFVEKDGLVWEKGTAPALIAVGVVRYRWDVFIPDIRTSRHCHFYERQLDRHERRHLLYQESLIRRLQTDQEDLVSRLLRKDPVSSHAESEGGLEAARPDFLRTRVERFVAEHRALRNRYWTASDEETRIVRETIAVTQADIEDLERNCLSGTATEKPE